MKETQKKPVIKIFATHSVGSNNYALRNGIFEAVRGGAYREVEHTLQPDCTGDNISEKNASYCELTTQYWAWKNVKADYYGFIHYRRMFSFSDEKFQSDPWEFAGIDYLNEDALKRIGVLNEDRVREYISQYDVVTPIPVKLKNVGVKSLRKQYLLSQKLNVKDLDLMMDIIKDVAPNYYDAAEEYLNGPICYLCNIFVLKKELFDEYCRFLFPVLEEFERRRDMSQYNAEAFRTPGHLGERMFGIFCTYLKKKGGYRIGERRLVYFTNTEAQPHFEAAFKKKNIPIIFACNEFYARFCSAALCSVAEHSSEENNYDVIFLGKDFSKATKEKLKSVVAGRKNFSVRFYDVGSLFASYHLFERPNISMETYYRLVIPEIFDVYDKVLYLDGDLIALDDVAKLYATNLGNNYLGAAHDIAHQGNLNGGNPDMEKYYRQFDCKDYKNFYNAGVLLMNTKLMRKDFSTRFLLDFAQQGAFMFQDQDLLNILCEGRILDIGYEWNFYGDPVQSYRGWFNSYAPHDAYKKYLEARKNIRIIHFAGNEKPWWNADQEFADIFWTYFRKTPYYESFLTQRMRDYAYDISKANQLGFVKKKEKNHHPVVNRGKFGGLLPKGSRRREVVKKIVCFLTHKTYIEPNYEAEGITPKYKKKKNHK